MKQYVLIDEDCDEGNVFCLGIFDNVYTAIGYAMERIWEFGESYRKDGDFFEYTPFEELGCECGWYCDVKYKATCWTHMKEPLKDTYFILEHETKEVKHDRLDDPISRQQTITALRALSDDDGYINAPHEVVTDVVRGLPPVQAKQGRTVHSEQTKKDKLGVKAGETYKDTISRRDAIAKLKEHRKIFCKNRLDFTILPDKDKARVDEIDNAIATLFNLPPAQQDIIRCKDCKYRDENWRRVSVKWLPCMDVQTPSNWFCGSAKRGEQDDEQSSH